ncbi:MAG: ribonuclease Y [Syntrophales bacterium]|jgi:ribonuclease Y|nr:ribonuclease Y [Syntrophales bacterium]HOG08067.1 ribonuclease Y [Syntrophales bacterium]HQN26437.1 ribonuclease Y [Syntrophales bacterium]HQP28883.1 ribonuclease Y [Syntrophales bacterium]
MSSGLIILFIVLAGAVGLVLGYALKQRLSRKQRGASERLGARIVDEAKKEAENIKKEAILQAKENLLKAKTEFERDAQERKTELDNLEKRLRTKEEAIDKRLDMIVQKEANLEGRDKALTQKESQIGEKHSRLDRMIEEQREQLEKAAGISAEEAKALLVQAMETEAKHEAALAIRKIEDETRRTADKKARDILAYSIQRYAGDVVAENTVSVVSLPNDEMKGRIIGREGRNIRAIEAATGIDLIVDDTPEAVVLSSFDPVRREVARLSLERLITDGRIHPGRIEDVVKKVATEVDSIIRETGERTSFDVGVHDIHPEILKLLGSLKYRTSYSQNVLQHSVDVAHLTGMMASELKMNVKEAKRAGLLHDIGKAIDHKVEGPHAAIGADFAKRYGESPRIIQAIATHHDDGRTNTILGVLVQAADTLSAARPGARREMLETYVRRLEELEAIANSFTGVDKCFAIQAGREIRILVENEKISDNDAVMLCRDIVKKIEAELTYPGQIKVTVIRETRVSEFAK